MRIAKPKGKKKNAVAVCHYRHHQGDLCWELLRANNCIEKYCRHLEITSPAIKSSIRTIRDSKIKLPKKQYRNQGVNKK